MANIELASEMSPFSIDDSAGTGTPPQKPIDANRYATKKTIAQGMLDIALLTANASQLKYILQVGEKHEFYKLMVTLISTSIVLQILVGILFLVIGGLNINKPKDCRSATILNDLILITVFLISILNVMISGFGFDNSTYTLQLMSESASASMTPVESVPPFRPS